MNFGPSFILRHDIYGANAISEVQPMSPEDRKVTRTTLLYPLTVLPLNFDNAKVFFVYLCVMTGT